MQVFLTRLTRLMKEVHPLGQVLWYDAVTVTGQLRWQDTLNDANRAFFDCCDGIFTNYTWRGAWLAQLHRRSTGLLARRRRHSETWRILHATQRARSTSLRRQWLSIPGPRTCMWAWMCLGVTRATRAGQSLTRPSAPWSPGASPAPSSPPVRRIAACPDLTYSLLTLAPPHDMTAPPLLHWTFFTRSLAQGGPTSRLRWPATHPSASGVPGMPPSGTASAAACGCRARSRARCPSTRTSAEGAGGRGLTRDARSAPCRGGASPPSRRSPSAAALPRPPPGTQAHATSRPCGPSCPTG